MIHTLILDESLMMKLNNLRWISTVYFAQGLPYALVSLVTAIMYKTLGISNEKIAFFTSLLFLPWSLKPLWAPILEMRYTKKQWLIRFQLWEVSLLAIIMFLLFSSHYFYFSVVLFLMLAFCSASYDIVSDGYYMLHLSIEEQSEYVGVRSLFYQLARLFTQGVLLTGVGYITAHHHAITAWQLFFLILALLTYGLAQWHRYQLPDQENRLTLTAFTEISAIFRTFKAACQSFFSIPKLFLAILFLLLYNAPEAQILKIFPLFLLDNIQHGGLGLNTSQVGILYGGTGGVSLMLGTLLGGITVTRYGFRSTLIITTILMTISYFGYYFLAASKGHEFILITAIIIVTQFLYGLANSAYMSFLLRIVLNLPYRTTCYALGTAIMCLSYMLFGSFSGYLQTQFGYSQFFMIIALSGIIVLLFTLVVIFVMEFKNHET